MIKAFLHPVTGKEMQYKSITKHKVLVPMYKIILGNELRKLLLGILNIKGTNNCFLVDLVDIPKGQKSHMENLCAILKHKKWRKNKSG